MYSLSTDSGLNGRVFRPLLSANTHERNFVFSPWTAGNPYIRHTHTHTHTQLPICFSSYYSSPAIHFAIASACLRLESF